MKILIASDIHGSSYHCKRLIERYNETKADRLILLGDILYHGPRNDLPLGYDTQKVIDMLNAVEPGILSVRGNCDSEVDQMVLKFPIMADYTLIPYKGRTLFLTHGHLFNKDKLPPLKKGDVLIHGHTHVVACETLPDGVIYINPGSVSIPKGGTSYGYMIFEDGKFTRYNLDGVSEFEFDLNEPSEAAEGDGTPS
ncbi:MAG: phosphodiesterase [Clostridia bacterium]|nr:phosphodiesterase [Clostridia bacterium]